MSKRILSSIAIALPIAAALWAGSDALARRIAPEPNPLQAGTGMKVAVVNLRRVLEGTDSGAKWTMHISNLQSSIEKERDAKKADLDRLNEEAQKEADPAKRAALNDDLMKRTFLAEEWLKLRMIEVDREKALRWQDLYRSLQREVKTIAQQNQIDLVLFDDAQAELKIDDKANQKREAQVLTQMVSLHILYSSEKIDITDQVLTRINNAANNPTSAAAPGTSGATGGS